MLGVDRLRPVANTVQDQKSMSGQIRSRASMIGQIIEALKDRVDDPAMSEIIERFFADLTRPEGARCWRSAAVPAPASGPQRGTVRARG